MSDEKLFASFAPLSRQQWEAKALQDLEGKAISDLRTTWQDLTIEPYYAIEDLEPTLQDPLLAQPAKWLNYVKITVDDVHEANEAAHYELMHGATGLLFEVPQPVELSTLLKGIDAGHCALAFKGAITLQDYLDYLSGKTKPAQLQGFIDQPDMQAFPDGPHFYPAMIGSTATTDWQELLNILQHLHRQLPAGDDQAAARAVSTAYKLQVPANYFMGIAKVRSLRLLLVHFFSAYGWQKQPADFHILAVSPHWQHPDLGPHENMLKATTAAMAAVIGGCNALLTEPGGDDPQERLVARNIALILEYEAHLDKVADPAAGSYFIENLTGQLVNKVWEAFLQQQHETAV
ncbi:MAG TPA: hypothetical protein ENJ39_04375 [Flammeovirgaceae bacterium]|nr:hypothetical protein [Flammeovirgaceae bacterium]